MNTAIHVTGRTGTYTLTTVAGRTHCTCPGYRYRSTCRHVIETAQEAPAGGAPLASASSPAPTTPSARPVSAPTEPVEGVQPGTEEFWDYLDSLQPSWQAA